MKEIKYVGSLTDDLDEINGRNKDNEITSTLFKVFKSISLIVVILFIISVITGGLNPVILSSLTSSLTAITITRAARTNNFAARNLKRMQLKTQISSLAFELSKRADFKEEYYTENIEDAVIIKNDERSNDESEIHESEIHESDIDDYIKEITSDIYFLSKHDKIKVLREIKSVFYSKDYERTISAATKLYELEENELPKQNKLPVKQVLKLRNDKK